MATLISDGSNTDVQAKINAANPGDTVTLPSGTFSWTAQVNCAKGITIQGNTTVTNTHADGSLTPATHDTPVINDLTNVVDDVVNRQAAGALLNLGGQPATDTLRVTGITFTKGSSSSGSNGGIRIEGTLSKLNRIDHCHIYHISYLAPLYIGTSAGGVVDHCVIEAGSPVGVFGQTIHCENGGGTWGDATWADIAHFGTDIGWWFIEDNYLYFTQPGAGSGGGIDCYRGGKYVVRYTILRNMQAQCHGLDSSGRIRSVRSIEIYNNVMLWDDGFSAGNGEFRGAGGLFHHNTSLNDNAVSQYRGSGNFRMFQPFSPWGAAWGDPARGNSVWDKNDTGNYTGNGFGGGPNGLFASGTHTGPNASSRLLIDNNHTWTTDQWAGYMVVNSTGTYNGSFVKTNDAHTMTLADNAWNANHISFNTNDGYEVHKVIQAIDGQGCAKGDLVVNVNTTIPNAVTLPVSTLIVNSTAAFPNNALMFVGGSAVNYTGKTPTSFTGCTGGSGTFPIGTTVTATIDQVTGTQVFPNQAIEPIYSWLNKDRNGTYIGVYAHEPGAIEGVTMFNQTAMPGYVPFTYPHPLTGGVPAVTKIIALSGNMAFGNVVIGSTSPTSLLTVANQGNTVLTVTAVSYPTGFSGPTSGFTVPANGTFGVTVTFTPLLAQNYSGNITVTSDATSGTNTILCTGTGTIPTPPVHGHKKQARDSFQF